MKKPKVEIIKTNKLNLFIFENLKLRKKSLNKIIFIINKSKNAAFLIDNNDELRLNKIRKNKKPLKLFNTLKLSFK